MHRTARPWLMCLAAAAVLALGGCSARARHGLLEGGFAAPCGAAFLGYHGPERCDDE